MNQGKETALKKLKTVRGQVDGIIRMIENDRYCVDISVQLLSTIGLLKKANIDVLNAHIRTCVADAILEGKDIRSNEVLEKHADWVEEFLPKYTDITKENIMDILHEEIGQVFNQVLEDAGVYKQTEEGRAAFERFIGSL